MRQYNIVLAHFAVELHTRFVLNIFVHVTLQQTIGNTNAPFVIYYYIQMFRSRKTSNNNVLSIYSLFFPNDILLRGAKYTVDISKNVKPVYTYNVTGCVNYILMDKSQLKIMLIRNIVTDMCF